MIAGAGAKAEPGAIGERRRGGGAEIPGPRGLPFIGWQANLLPVLRRPIEHLLWLRRKYGDVVSLSRGSTDVVFVFSPELNRQVLSDQHLFYNGEVNSAATPMRLPPDSAAFRLFSGITTRNGAEHTRQRRLLMPAFHRKRVEALRDEMVSLAERHVSRWYTGEEVDLLREMKDLTLAVAVKAILGLDPEREGVKVRRLMERWFRLALEPRVVLLPYDIAGLPFHRMLRLAEAAERQIRGMIRRRKARGPGATGGRDALSILLEAHDDEGIGLTDNELIGHTAALFVAGHETTASALTWTLFLLDRHPRVLSALLDEFDSVLGGNAPGVDQISKERMPLLDAVINESMRLLPPGLWFLRVATAPTHFGPYDIPEGTRILWTPVVAQRDPSLFPEPDRFNPYRWQSIDPSPYEYLPFGAGPRRCLGAVFAVTEMKLVLPIILQRFRPSLVPGAKVSVGGSPLAAPSHGLPVRLLPRGSRPPQTPVRGNIRKIVRLSE